LHVATDFEAALPLVWYRDKLRPKNWNAPMQLYSSIRNILKSYKLTLYQTINYIINIHWWIFYDYFCIYMYVIRWIIRVCLFIIAKELECMDNLNADGVLTQSIIQTCGLYLQPDIINLTCSNSFRGNISPSLIWKKIGTQELAIQKPKTQTIINNRVSSSLIIQANEQLSGQKFSCNVDCPVMINNTGSCNLFEGNKWISRSIVLCE